VDTGRGSIETRNCGVYTDLSYMETPNKWSRLSCVAKIESIRHEKISGKEQKETRLYICSNMPSAKLIAKSVRAHWGIENSLHWVMM